MDSLKTISKATIKLLVGIFVLSIYFIQRALYVFTDVSDLSKWKSGYQINFLGLEFSYRTLTLIWPLILGTLCLSFYYLTEKQIFIWSCLRRDFKEFSNEILPSIDPFLITPRRINIPGSKLIWHFIFLVPIFAIIIHFSSGLSTLIMVFFKAGFFTIISTLNILITTLFLFVSSIFGILSGIYFLKAIIHLRDTFD